MNQMGKDELFKFIAPNYKSTFITIVVIIALGTTMSILNMITTGDDMDPGLIFGILLMLILFLAFFAIIPGIKILMVKKTIQNFEDDNKLQDILYDFNHGLRLASGNICLGKQYIIGRHAEEITTYDELERVYEYVHSTNFVKDKRQLRAVMAANDDVRVLAELPLKGIANEELLRIFHVIHQHNPEVQFGTR